MDKAGDGAAHPRPPARGGCELAGWLVGYRLLRRFLELGELLLTVLDRGPDRLPHVLGPRFEQHRP